MPIPTGYAQANLIFTGGPIPSGAQVTLGLDVSAFAGTPSEAAQEIQDAAVASNLVEQLATGVVLSDVLVKFGPDATGPSGNASGSETGLEGAATPPNTAILVQKHTAFGGRAGRGRMYLPSPNESKVDPTGLLDSTYVSNIQTSVDAFGAALSTAFLTPVVLHGENSPLTTPSEITGFSVSNRVATQRRRLRR